MQCLQRMFTVQAVHSQLHTRTLHMGITLSLSSCNFSCGNRLPINDRHDSSRSHAFISKSQHCTSTYSTARVQTDTEEPRSLRKLIGLHDLQHLLDDGREVLQAGSLEKQNTQCIRCHAGTGHRICTSLHGLNLISSIQYFPRSKLHFYMKKSDHGTPVLYTLNMDFHKSTYKLEYDMWPPTGEGGIPGQVLIPEHAVLVALFSNIILSHCRYSQLCV